MVDVLAVYTCEMLMWPRQGTSWPACKSSHCVAREGKQNPDPDEKIIHIFLIYWNISLFTGRI